MVARGRLRSLPAVERTRPVWLAAVERMRRSGDYDPKELDEVASYITHGVGLSFAANEPPSRHYQNTPLVEQQAEHVAQRIAHYMQIGAVVRVDDGEDTPWIHPLHVVMKEGAKPRVVVDCSRNLNDYLQQQPFKMEGVQQAVAKSWRGCWFGKHDLSDCYLSFPLSQEAARYLVFSFQGKLYRFVRLPFGLSVAPRVCELLLSVVSFELRRLGVRHVRYLDDFLYIGGSAAALARAMSRAAVTLARFGLVVNPSKTVSPTQDITFLGVGIDSRVCCLYVTPERVQEMKQLCRWCLVVER